MWPAVAPATTPTQIPEEARGLRGSAASSQPLKSPMTLTARAPGAQTANAVPAWPS